MDSTQDEINRYGDMESVFLQPLQNAKSLTLDWLQLMLSNFYMHRVNVDNFEIKLDHGKEGFLSELVYLLVSYKMKSEIKTEKLVFKFLPSDADRVKFIFSGHLAKRESDFYSLAGIQLFKDILSELDMVHVIPRVYYCKFNNENLTLVLNDLNELGYKTIINRDGSSFRQTKTTFESLAAVHATGLCLYDDAMKFIGEYPDNSFLLELLDSNFKVIIKMFEKTDLEKIFIRLQHYTKEIVNFSLYKTILKTIIHGDLWAGQCMFSENEEKVCILDWQFCSVGDPIRDLQSFFSMSTSADVLDSHFEVLLKGYWAVFLHYLTMRKVDIGITYSEFMQSFEDQWMVGFLYLAASLHDFLDANNISEERFRGYVSFLHKRDVFNKFMSKFPSIKI